jgi:hypothetical protein
MKPASAILRRVLTTALAILPPLAGMDLCTVGAVTGRADLMCGMERTASVCQVKTAPRACPYCAPAEPRPTLRVGTPAPAPAPAPSRGPTCCDLRPQAAGTGEAPALGVPSIVAHPAAAAASVSGIAPPPSAVPVVSDAGRAPPGDRPPPLSPRAPPLS